MINSKPITFIGFAIKARKVRFGVGAVSTLKPKVPLLILCDTASDNTKNDAVKLSKKLHSTLLIATGVKVEEIVYKEKCKLIAITDEGLAKAIIENLDCHFTKYSGGYGYGNWRKERS